MKPRSPDLEKAKNKLFAACSGASNTNDWGTAVFCEAIHQDIH